MIGQEQLLNDIDTLISKNSFPRFSIIVGEVGSGKHLITDYISHKLGYVHVNVDTKVDDIREMITNSYTQTENIIYCIHDVDNMSQGAMNALLKITEEPPNKARFIITCVDSNKLLGTIKSRGTIFNVLPYSRQELDDYLGTKTITEEERKIILSICNTPGMINSMLNHNTIPFYNYVKLVFDNIDSVSWANSFKIGEKIALKKTEEGTKYDLALFFRAFMQECRNRLDEDRQLYLDWIIITSKYLSDTSIKSLNKPMLFDNWLIEIRGY